MNPPSRLPLRSPVVEAAVFFLLLTILACVALFWLAPDRFGQPLNTDFHAFLTVAQLFRQGRLPDAYDEAAMMAAMRQLWGNTDRIPWAYPPPFDLLLLPLGIIPPGLGVLLLGGLSLAAFGAALRRIAGSGTAFVLVALLPGLIINTVCTQNGFLTAALVALACHAILQQRDLRAGCALGAMVIKPHLVMVLAASAVLAGGRRLVLAAALTVCGACALATAAFGIEVWPAFLKAAGVSRDYLLGAGFPLYRMASPYALARLAGAPAATSLLLQGCCAMLGVAVLVRLRHWQAPMRIQLGWAVLASLLITPYLYDYDLPLLAVALALLLPVIETDSGRPTRALVVLLCWIASGSGLVVVMLKTRLSLLADGLPVPAGTGEASLAGLGLIGLLPVLIVMTDRALRTSTAATALAR